MLLYSLNDMNQIMMGCASILARGLICPIFYAHEALFVIYREKYRHPKFCQPDFLRPEGTF
jgi:hypothetical protein